MVKQRVEVIVYRGITFRRYPDAKQWAHRNYFSPGGADRLKGVDDLHREIWRDNFGPIPDGHAVHHKDANTSNNEPSNLELQTKGDHAKHHLRKRFAKPGGLARAREHVAAIRPLAKAWHRSKEGKEWHSKQAKANAANLRPSAFTCTQCGREYQAIDKGNNKFCSRKCAARARWQSGLDDIDFICKECLRTFKGNRFDERKFCSKKCSKTHYWREKRRLQSLSG